MAVVLTGLEAAVAQQRYGARALVTGTSVVMRSAWTGISIANQRGAPVPRGQRGCLRGGRWEMALRPGGGPREHERSRRSSTQAGLARASAVGSRGLTVVCAGDLRRRGADGRW